MVAVQSVTGQMLALQMSKQNPQAIGALGGFRLKSRPLLRIGVSGDKGYKPEQFVLSRAVLQATIALWCNAIGHWYAAVSPGRPNIRSAWPTGQAYFRCGWT
jgi:hypothetical protein